MTRLTSEFKAAKSLSLQMINACEFADKTCDMSNPTQLMASPKQIAAKLHELKDIAFPQTSTDKTDLIFTDKHHLAVKQIGASLRKFCEVDWKQHIDPRRTTVQFAQNHKGGSQYEATLQTIDTTGQK